MEAMSSAVAAGVLVDLIEDGESSWSPTFQVMLLASSLSAVGRRCMIARLLAHRALGHWGRAEWQIEEARMLACSWLFTPAEFREARRLFGDRSEPIAEHLTITQEVAEWMLARHQPKMDTSTKPQQWRSEPYEDPNGRVGRRIAGTDGVWIIDWTGTADWPPINYITAHDQPQSGRDGDAA